MAEKEHHLYTSWSVFILHYGYNDGQLCGTSERKTDSGYENTLTLSALEAAAVVGAGLHPSAWQAATVVPGVSNHQRSDAAR